MQSCRNYCALAHAILFQSTASQRPVGGHLIQPAEYDRQAPAPVPYSMTNAGYDQPPPAYDSVEVNNAEGVSQEQQGVPIAAPPSYYELYKDSDALADESEPTGSTFEQGNRSDVQESRTEADRNDSRDS